MKKNCLLFPFALIVTFVLVFSFFQAKPVKAESAATPSTYHSYAQLTQTVKKMAQAHPNLVQLISVGKTSRGKDIWGLILSNRKKGDPDEKAAVCVVGNIDGNHLIGSEIICFTARYLLENYAETDSIQTLLDNQTFYLIPRVNIDAAETMFQSPLFEQSQTNTPVDDDYDGLVDEDRPEDLNGDGLITMMRVPDIKGEWVADSLDARLLRKADSALGELGKYRLQTEGIDNDGDELINEDPCGGVDLNKNFPHNYPQFEKGTGKYMLSEPESRALVEFILAHQNITQILVYGNHDNLITPPKSSSPAPKSVKKQKKPEKSSPITEIDADDIFIYQRVSAVYKKLTQIEATPVLAQDKGAFHQWGYFQFGVPVYCARVWWPPTPPKLQAATDSSQTDSTKNLKSKPASPEKGKKQCSKKKKQPEKSDDKKWLTWIDQNLPDRGFINWQAFQHPTLGVVEIGGFKPFLRTNPPAAQIADFAQRHTNFTLFLASLFPKLHIDKVKVEKRGDSVYRISVEIMKTGFLPSLTTFAEKHRIARPTLARLIAGDARLLAGEKNVKLNGLRLNQQRQKIEWLVFGKPGTKLILEILSEKAGKIKQEIILK